MNKKWYHEKIIDEIVEMIKDNLMLLYNFNDLSLLDIKDYCKDKFRKRYTPLPYNLLIDFTNNALIELLNNNHLYDFRDLD